MNWELQGQIWVCSVHGVPIAFVKRMNAHLFIAICAGPDGMLATVSYANHTACKTIYDVEATLQNMGWNVE